MLQELTTILDQELNSIREGGLYKGERVIFSPQQSRIKVKQGDVINFCANNYLGLANSPELIRAAIRGLETHGFGMSSVRFICGTQDLHKTLEEKIARFLTKDDAILYSSCFDANGGLFETLLTEADAIISDQLNHASIIDGIRLCKAKRFRYKNSDMNELEDHLKATQNCRLRMIATDGVFSMDGYIAHLKEIVDLAEKYHAVVMVDDSHATGFIGATGRGSPEYREVLDRVDIITSTFGKALGGASGGFTASSSRVVEMLRQRSRPYLFSNSMPPPLVAASIAALDLIASSDSHRKRLMDNTLYFRRAMDAAGFDIKKGEHPIVPVMFYDAVLAAKTAEKLLTEGIYVIAFSYPVVPKNEARIRVQISAAHTKEDLDRAVDAFKKCVT